MRINSIFHNTPIIAKVINWEVKNMEATIGAYNEILLVKQLQIKVWIWSAKLNAAYMHTSWFKKKDSGKLIMELITILKI